ncbi:MAG: SRPBCC family protein [Kofleriaceae bacterium]
MKKTMKVSTPTETSILLERDFDAPRTLVWRALSEPELVKKWWGCSETPMTRCDIDFRVGGTWRFELRMPDGSSMGQSGEYLEIEKPARIVNTESMDGHEGSVLVTYTLVEAAGKASLTCLTECHSVMVRDIIMSSGMESGAGAAYDRLEEIARSFL